MSGLSRNVIIKLAIIKREPPREELLDSWDESNVSKTINNASINFGYSYDQVRRMLELSLRETPDEVYYSIERIMFKFIESSNASPEKGSKTYCKDLHDETLQTVRNYLYDQSYSNCNKIQGSIYLLVRIFS